MSALHKMVHILLALVCRSGHQRRQGSISRPRPSTRRAAFRARPAGDRALNFTYEMATTRYWHRCTDDV